MQVILLDKVAKLGTIGDQVNVKAGYARNYLIPTGKAELATPANLKAFESRRQELEAQAAARLAEVQKLADSITSNHAELVITASAGNEGKLFGSIGAKDIEDALKAQGVDVKKSQIRIAEGTIRQLGNYNISLHLHAEVDVAINLSVVATK